MRLGEGRRRWGRSVASYTLFAGLPPSARWDGALGRILPYAMAISTGFGITRYVVAPQGIGFDARLYVAAADAWLRGGNPWQVTSLGVPFAAPPPTLLALAPFTVLPTWVLTPVFVVGSFLLAALAIRSLNLPMWWLTFWPIVDGAMVGNPDVAVLWALVIASRRADVLAPILKIYALIPLVGERRWRSLISVGLILLASAPILPWAQWVEALPSSTRAFEAVAQPSAALGHPVLLVVALIALTSLGFRRAAWLAVPVLWPWTQTHYFAMSTPALTPTLAIIWGLPVAPPVLVLGAVIASAIGFRLWPARPDTSARAWLPSVRPPLDRSPQA